MGASGGPPAPENSRGAKGHRFVLFFFFSYFFFFIPFFWAPCYQEDRGLTPKIGRLGVRVQIQYREKNKLQSRQPQLSLAMSLGQQAKLIAGVWGEAGYCGGSFEPALAANPTLRL